MPIQDISIGQFSPRNSVLHRLDPRTKLAVGLLLMIVLFLVKTLPGLASLLLFTLLLYRIGKLDPVLALKSIRPFLWLFGLTLILHAFWTPGGQAWRVPGTGVLVSKTGLRQGFFYALRMADLMALAGLFTLTTSPMSFADALERLLSPFRRVGLPVHELAMMMSISIRFIPILIEETERIRQAQLSRGADFGGNLVRRIRGIVPVFVPLLVSSFHRANDLALAMDSRCYHGGSGRTCYHVLKMRASDWSAIILMSCAGALGILTERVMG
jgi:energy-coupling factor transport system permease protein